MLSKSITLLTLAASAVAGPVARQSNSIDPALQNITYSVMSIRSGSPLQYLPLNAISGRFYLGGTPTTYCPPQVQASHSCPPGNQTVFKSSCSLDSSNSEYYNHTEQTLWNTDDGVIGYDTNQTQPANALNCPWYLGTSQNSALLATVEATAGADGFIACRTKEEGVWQVLRSISDQSKIAAPLGNVSDCLGVALVAITPGVTGPAAYVYS